MLIALALFAIFAFKPFESTAFLYTSLSAYAASIWCPKMHTKNIFVFILRWEKEWEEEVWMVIIKYQKKRDKKFKRIFQKHCMLVRWILKEDHINRWFMYVTFLCWICMRLKLRKFSTLWKINSPTRTFSSFKFPHCLSLSLISFLFLQFTRSLFFLLDNAGKYLHSRFV